jgi:hypothetical protein
MLVGDEASNSAMLERLLQSTCVRSIKGRRDHHTSPGQGGCPPPDISAVNLEVSGFAETVTVGVH